MTVTNDSIRQIIEEIIILLGAQDEYKTLVIGIIAGEKEEVSQTEKEFDEGTKNLLASNMFIKLSGFGFKEK